MIHSQITISTLDQAIFDYFSTFKEKLLVLHFSQWDQEDLKGKSEAQWTAMQYYYFMYLLILIYLEVERTQDLEKDWDYYKGKYNLDAVQKCIGCYGIDWNKGLAAFGLNNLIPGGIEDMQIESNFIIHGDALPVSDVKIKDLISNPYICINYIENVGVEQVSVENQTTSYFDTIQDTIDNNDGRVEDT